MGVSINPIEYSAIAANIGDAPHWYVAYTYPRHEKAVVEQIQLRSVETFLPTYTVKSQWKDRRVQLELPLFAGYVFTRMASRERVKVLSVPSVIRILSYRGMPVPIGDSEIDAIRMGVAKGAKFEPHPYIAVGDRVRVREGAFEGLEGIVVRKSNQCRLVVSLSLIHQSVSLEVEPASLEIIKLVNMDAIGQRTAGQSESSQLAL